MIRHMLTFSLRPDVSVQDTQALMDDMAAFPQRFPKMTDLQIGRNVSWRDDRFAYGMTMTFDRLEDLDAYLRSDFHEQFVRDRFRPLITERAIVTFEV